MLFRSEILRTLNDNEVEPVTLYLELGFRERNPDDREAILQNSISVKYWLDAGTEL